MKQSIILSTYDSVFDFCDDRSEYLDASATKACKFASAQCSLKLAFLENKS